MTGWASKRWVGWCATIFDPGGPRRMWVRRFRRWKSRTSCSTRYGLAGYVWTRDLGRAHRVAAALDAGYISVNGMASLPPAAPFGGFGASGYGVEGGRWGIQEFLRCKNVHVSRS